MFLLLLTSHNICSTFYQQVKANNLKLTMLAVMDGKKSDIMCGGGGYVHLFIIHACLVPDMT